MGTDLRHLQIEATKNLPTEWQKDLDDLRDGYPFEAVRRNRIDLDGHRPQDHTVIEPTSEFRTIVAHFDDNLVGWMNVQNLPLLSKMFSSSARFVAEELVQRNRDDIRHHLIEWLRHHFPDQSLMTWHPTQNRTARQFLQSEGFKLVRTVHHFGKKLNQTTKKPTSDSETPESLGIENLSKNAILPGNASLLNPDSRPEYLEELLRLHYNSERRTPIVSQHDPLNVLFLRKHESGARVCGDFLLNEVNSEVITKLLEDAEEHLSSNCEYFEILIPDPARELTDTLSDRGFQSLTKRMFHLDVPESLQSQIELV